MSDFARFVCWAEQTVTATIATEAVSPSDNVFLATHHPLDIHRTTVASGQVGATTIVNEKDLLSDFLDRPTNKGVLIIPVLGESGTGKSHLVRWVHAHVRSTADRQVIYLPKDNTTLAGVVKLLLIGNEGPLFDEIREDLDRLGQDMTHEALQHALLDKLAAALLTATARPEDPQERALVGELGLRALLVDPFFRQKILRPDGLIARRAAHILDGRSQSSGDIPMEFAEEDLPLDIADIMKAAQPTQKIFRRLASDPRLQVAARRLLQQNLDVAVMEATNLGVGRVSRAFLDIRKALVGKKEIVLLVEDFALVQGVQRDLLDAITETSERDGRQVYAPVRTLMAVTSGYFDGLAQTVRTRVDAATAYHYHLRVNLGNDADPATEQRVTDLLGRYLNAARIGRERLEAEGVRSAAAAPNACAPCVHREECHSGFGSSSDGYGLYPYNKSALLRAVRATALSDRDAEFNPRAALAQAIRGVLQEHADDIRKGNFPNREFEERFPRWRTGSVLSPTVQAQINRADSRDADRRQVLLQYWGDAPSTLVNLPDPIHTAFSLPRLDDLIVLDERVPDLPDDSREEPSGRPASRYRASALKRFGRVEEWQSLSKPMDSDDAREIRTIIRDAVISQVSWTEPLMKEPTSDLIDKAWPKNSMARVVSIDGAGETGAQGATPLLRFERSPENALFFISLLKIKEGHHEGGALGAILRLRAIATQLAPRLRDDVARAAGRDDDAVVGALRVSLIGATLAGAVRPGDTPERLLSAAVAKLSGHRRTDLDTRTPQWTRQLEIHLRERGDLVARIREAIGTAQGTTGSVHAIDAKRALRLVRRAATQWTLGSNTPEWAKKAATPLTSALLEPAVAQQLRALQDHLREIRLRLPTGTSFRETVKAVTAAFETGERASMVPVPDLRQVRESNQRAADLKSAAVDRLEQDLGRLAEDASWSDRFSVAAEDRGVDLMRIREYLESSEAWLDAGLRTQTSSPSEETQHLVDELSTATAMWRDIAGRLAEGTHERP